MTTRNYSTISQETTLTAALSSSATTMTVQSSLALFGGTSVASGQTFTVVIDPDTSLEEVVDVIYPSSTSSTILTIQRNIDSSVAVAHSAGAKVRHMAIGRDFREANTHIEASANVHGVGASNSVVGTGTTQTLTNKTIDATLNTISNIANSNIASAAAIDKTKIAGVAVTTGDTGTVTSTMILDGTIVNADINAAAAIDKTKISGTAVTVADTGTVTSTMIADGTITNTDINTSAAIDKTKIAGTAVTLTDTGTVTSTMIADGTITNSDINAAAGIAYSKLSLTGSITSSDITNGTIVDADISATAAIANSKLATNPLARANHTGTQTASTISDFDTQVRTSRLDQMAAPTASVSLNSQKITSLATPTVSTDASTKGYVDTQISNLVGTAPSTLDTLQEIAAAINSDPNLYTTLNNAKLNRDGTQAMTGALSMGTNKITNVVDPTSAQDAATKNYTDTAMTSQVAQAASSATAAATSATNAASSATSASSSASSASTSATAASTSATAALASQNAAATSATNASNSATSAGASATTATTQATNAATSASNASTYAANAATSASSASTDAATVAGIYDSFDDRYLGSKSSAPTLDNDGNALLTGAIYWNTIDNAMYVWKGSAWGSISSTADIFRYKFTASGGETSKSGVDDNSATLSYLPGKEQVYLNGVLLVRGIDYTASTGTSITGLTALAASDVLEIITFTAFDVSTAVNKSSLTAKGSLISASAAQTPATLLVGTDGYYLQADSTQTTGLKWAAVSGYSAPTLGSTSIASGATVTTINGLTKLQSAQYTSLDGSGYEKDIEILTIMGAY